MSQTWALCNGEVKDHMGSMTALGIFLAVVVFLLAGSIWNAIFGMSLSLWVALAAGGFTFKYFYDKDMESLKKLLEPEEQVWPVPYPIAWGCIIDVLKRSGVETGVSGRSSWRIVQEDDSRGYIEAKLTFQQMLGVGQNSKAFGREIGLVAQLTAQENTTKVKLQYQIFSPAGAGMVRNLIEKNQNDFRAYVEVNRLP